MYATFWQESSVSMSKVVGIVKIYFTLLRENMTEVVIGILLTRIFPGNNLLGLSAYAQADRLVLLVLD